MVREAKPAMPNEIEATIRVVRNAMWRLKILESMAKELREDLADTHRWLMEVHPGNPNRRII